jgi:hypothetical protein
MIMMRRERIDDGWQDNEGEYATGGFGVNGKLEAKWDDSQVMTSGTPVGTGLARSWLCMSASTCTTCEQRLQHILV